MKSYEGRAWLIGFLYAIFFLTLTFTMCSCKSVKYTPIETVRTEIVNNTDTLQIWQHDSIFIHQKSDTVWVEKYKYIDRWHTKINIEQHTDSIPYAVERIVEVNKLTAWQRWQIGGFWGILLFVIGFLVVKIVELIYLRK